MGKELPTNSAGVDLRKKTAVVCVANQSQQALRALHLVCNGPDGLRAWFAGPGLLQVVMEAPARSGRTSVMTSRHANGAAGGGFGDSVYSPARVRE